MTAIEIKNLSKSYRLYHSPKDRLRELVSVSRQQFHRKFYALKDVSFEVARGETVGIIGQNGSGKSTLLKIICGVVRPTSGHVTVRGRISSLLELGTGFHPEFTGRDNVYMNGALMGLSRGEMDKRFPEIEAFADIGEYIDQAVKTYSSGMYVRLAFAAAINIDPDILVVDEALAVGDMFFQAKSVATMNALVKKGTTLIVVSHDLWAVKRLCSKCVWLDEGRVVDSGPASSVVEKYFATRVRREQAGIRPARAVEEGYRPEGPTAASEDGEFQKRASFQRVQNGRARFLNVELLDDAGRRVGPLAYDQRVTLRMAVEVEDDLPSLISGYHIRDRYGTDLVYSDGVMENSCLVAPRKGERYLIDWSFRVALMHETYTVVCVLSCPVEGQRGVEFCDFVPVALQFTVMPRDPWPLHGRVHWENHVEIRNLTLGSGPR